MPDCKALSSHWKHPPFITKTNMFEVIPSTFELSPGTTVTLSCVQGFKIQGDSSLTCLPNGEWNYTTIPVCKEIETNTATSWFNSTIQLIIICTLALAALAVFALVIKIDAILIRQRRENEHNKRHRNQREAYNQKEQRHGRHNKKLTHQHGHHQEIYEGSDYNGTSGHYIDMSGQGLHAAGAYGNYGGHNDGHGYEYNDDKNHSRSQGRNHDPDQGYKIDGLGNGHHHHHHHHHHQTPGHVDAQSAYDMPPQPLTRF